LFFLEYAIELLESMLDQSRLALEGRHVMRVGPQVAHQTFRPGKSSRPMLLLMAGILGLSAVLLLYERSRILPLPQSPVGSKGLPFGEMPLTFEPNVGQADPSVRFSARRPEGTLLFTEQGIEIGVGRRTTDDGRQVNSSSPALPAQDVAPSLSLQFVGANPNLRLEGADQLPGKVNYFKGADPSGWHTNVATYAGLTYREIYPGVSLSYVGSGTGLKGTYTLSPNAEPSLIRWRYVGARSVTIDQSGNLVVSFDEGRTTKDEGNQSKIQNPKSKIIESAPVAWQEIDGQRVSVSAGFNLAADGTAAFSLGAYDPAYPLTIDPVLTYSTYFGGSGSDAGYGIAVDGAGNIYVAGQTSSTDFPLEDPFQPSSGGSPDAFITKLNPSGTELIYSTYFGGSGLEWPRGIAIDSAGNVAIAGRTSSSNLPLMNPVQAALAGSNDIFVTKLNSTGSTLVFSTYLGGSDWDEARSVAEDPSGNVYVTGETSSTNFPLLNPLQPAFGGGLSDAFVTKISSPGSQLIYSTYLGGEQTFGGDIGFGIAADASGNAYVTGDTTAMDFPVANAFQPTNHGGESEAFVSKINPSGSAFVYSTYLGGGQAAGGSGADTGYAITADASGNAYITGDTDSTDFPVRNPMQPQLNGFYDVFVAKMNTTGSDLVYATYLGGENGSGNERGQGIAVDPSGSASIVGITDSPDFPMVNPVQAVYGTALDAFAFRLTPSGSALSFSTYLGGSGSDYGQAAAVDGSGNTYATGLTASTNFPLANPYQATNATPFDLFISKISDVSFATTTPTATITSLPTSTSTTTATVATATSTPLASTSTSTPMQPSSTATVASTATATVTAPPTNTATPLPTPFCGLTWREVPNPLGGTLFDLDSTSAWDVWAVGSNGAMHWDGNNWTVIPVPVTGLIEVSAAAPDDVWAVNSGRVIHWDGTAWSLEYDPPNPPQGHYYSDVEAISADDVWVVGQQWTSYAPSTLTMHWDGVAWTIIPSPSSGTRGNYLSAVSGISSSLVWAVGGWSGISEVIVSWDGSQWVRQYISSGFYYFYDVHAIAADDVWAVGINNQSFGASGIVHYDGTAWSGVAVPDIGALNEVHGVSSDDVWAVGDRGMIHWNGSTWSQVEDRQLALSGVHAISADEAWAVGDVLLHYSGALFSDVPPGSTFYPYVQCLACRGIISGYSDGTFRPSNEITRGQIAKVVSNAAALDDDPGPQVYEDVAPDNTFYAWVNRLSGHGYMGGYPCGGEGEPCGAENRPYFRPFANATRGQIAKIVSNAAGYNDVPAGQMFEDVPVDHPFYPWIQRLASRGIMGGYPCGGEGEPCGAGNRPYFRSGNNATRGQTAKIVSSTFFPDCPTP
jgi:hypothetical protein